MVHPFRTQRSPLVLALLLLPLFAFALAPRAAEAGSSVYDGRLSSNWAGGDGFATWAYSGEVRVAAAVATRDLLYAVGDYESPPGTRSLHFQAVDRNGEIRGDRSCRDSTGDFGAFTDESAGVAAILDSTGNLLIGGWMTFQGEARLHALLARYEIDQTGCTLDESFSTDGFRLFDTQSYCSPESCAIVALGEIRPATGAVEVPRIVALLRATVAVASYRYFLIGLTASGSLDTTFGSGTTGIREVVIAGLGTLRTGAALAVDDQGRILVLLTRLENGTSSDLDAVALRYTPGGDPDTSFGASGFLPIFDTGVDDAEDATAAGLVALPEPGHYFASASRGSIGSVLVDIAPDDSTSDNGLPNSTAALLAVQGNRRLLAATEFLNFDSFRSFRYALTPGGYDLDPFYSSGDYESYDIDLGGGTGQFLADLVTWAGRPVIAGHAYDSDLAAIGFLMRAENRYIFADGFEGGNRARWWGY